MFFGIITLLVVWPLGGQLANAAVGRSSLAAASVQSPSAAPQDSLVGWGLNDYGQTSIPPGLSNVVAIAPGRYHSLALQAGGQVFGWGNNDDGQATIPLGLSNVVAIAAGARHSLALKADGTVAAWGNIDHGQMNFLNRLSNVVAIAANSLSSLAQLGISPAVPQPIILPSPMVLGVAGQPFCHRVVAGNNLFAFGAKGLPAGLSINPASGLITGSVPEPGIHQVTLTATNEFSTGEKTLAIRINGPGGFWLSNPRVATLASGVQRLAFILGGQVGRVYQIEQSADLVDWLPVPVVRRMDETRPGGWQPVGDLTNATGWVEFEAYIAADRKARFYRAALKKTSPSPVK